MHERFVPRPGELNESFSRGPTQGADHLSNTTGFGQNGSRSERAQVQPDLGLLNDYVRDPKTTDVFVNGENGLWIDRGHGLEQHQAWAASEQTVRNLASMLVAAGGRHVDEAHPCVDACLSGGVRVHAMLPPISTSGTLISVRIPRAEGFSLGELARAGLVDDNLYRFLVAVVLARRNVLISGSAGSGKTTLLGALLAHAPSHDRIIAIEDSAELRVAHPHFLSIQTRQANLEGAGEIGLERLVREALRMRPDRLVLGECRGAEVRELLAALNTGHDGGAGTLHANSLRDVPARLEALGALAGLGPTAMARQAVSAISIILHLERRENRRRLAQVGQLALGRDERLRVDAVMAVGDDCARS